MATRVLNYATVVMDYEKMLRDYYRTARISLVPRVYFGSEAVVKPEDMDSSGLYILEFFREIHHNGRVYHWILDYGRSRMCLFRDDGAFSKGVDETSLDGILVKNPFKYDVTKSNIHIHIPLSPKVSSKKR